MKLGVLSVLLHSLATLFVVATVHGADRSEAKKDDTFKIEDKLLDESLSRKRLPDTKVNIIVIHFSSDVLANPDSPYDLGRVIKIYKKYRVSAHLVIDRDGRIFRLVDEKRQAYHAGKGKLPWRPETEDKLNNYSIGIELLAIGSYEDMKIFMSKEQYDELRKAHPEHIGFTDPQYKSLNWLIDDIRARWPGINRDRRHIIGHSDYAPERRTDPGELFEWEKIGLGSSTKNGDPSGGSK